MKAYKLMQQLDIFNLDILEPLNNKSKKKVKIDRMTNKEKRLYYTLKISNILDNNCKGCPYESKEDGCIKCPFYEELLNYGRELSKTMDHKVHKESWEYDKNEKNDHYIERLYTFQFIKELESVYTYEELKQELEFMSISELAKEIDCEYNVLRSFLNKYKKKGE